MGTAENGKTVPIDGVFIMLHGESDRLLAKGEGIFVDQLEKKTIRTIVMTACNTGNLNFENNVASQFAMSQNVDQVVAPDGFGYLDAPGAASSWYGSDYKSEEFAIIERDGLGFVLFQNIEGSLHLTPGLTVDKGGISIINLYKKAALTGFVQRLVEQTKSISEEILKELIE